MMKYDKIKSSGIEWLGNVPNHWQLLRIKELAKKVKTGTTPSSAKGDFFSDGTEDWFTPSDINDNDISNSSRKVILDAFKHKELEYFPNNSIYLIGIGGTLGKSAISTVKASCNQQINVIVFNDKIIFPRFAFYQMLVIGSTLIKWSNYTTMPIFTQTNTKYLSLALPKTLEEQTAIATYLDHKTAAIDRKIALLEQKASQYQQLRKSLINQTVCRGLNKTAKLKDRGIEWIGMIPEHWEVKRLKDVGFLYSGLSGKSGDDFNQEERGNSKPYIPFVNVANNFFIDHNSLSSVLMDDNEKQNKVRKGDLFFLMSSENYDDIGKSAILAEDMKDTYLNSFCKGFRVVNERVYSNFINYQLNSSSFRDKLRVQGKGFTRINLKMEKITDFQIIIPPFDEQIKIAEYLDNRNKIVDSILANIANQVGILKELRKTLINDAVTGKIKVTEGI